MNPISRFAAVAAVASMALATPVLAQSRADEDRFRAAQQRFDNELNTFRAEYDRYTAARANYRGNGYNDPRYNDPRYNDPRNADPRYNDPRYADRDEGGYDASRYYRDGSQYQERVLSNDDRVYRGNDGRYYCKRNDGTTGLIIGGAGGAILGNVIDGGHSRIVGTLLGGALGAVAGKAIDQGSTNNQVRCR
jgi:hypothetical protein